MLIIRTLIVAAVFLLSACQQQVAVLASEDVVSSAEVTAATMHPAWDRDGDGINDCESNGSCDHTVDYSQPPPRQISQRILYVGPERRACQGMVPRQCLMVRTEADGRWNNMYEAIAGFEWRQGITYKLLVEVELLREIRMDASSVQYRLIEVLDKQVVR